MTATRYQEIYQNHKWDIPQHYNIAEYICDRYANDRNRLALIYEDEHGQVSKFTFKDLKLLSNKLANVYTHLGVCRGDRIGLVLSQQPETVIAHLAGFKVGAINIPLFTLFGPEALEYRLSNSGARIVLVDSENLPKIMEIRPRLKELEYVICVGKPTTVGDGLIIFHDEIENASDGYEPVVTSPDDPALIIYTSGTTGPPKGALHAHRVVLGHLPGVEMPHNYFPQAGDLFWTPADWAWIGGLIDVLFPSLHHGIPVLACRLKKFDPEEAVKLMVRHQVRNTFLPPTALKIMRSITGVKEKYGLTLRTVASGGEPLGEEILSWGRSELGLEINEFYGQTEANLLVANCSEIMPIKPGSMGRAVPGHALAIVDEHGNPLPPGQLGEVAVKRGDPVMFLGYWQNEKATRDKFIGDWMLTGDAASLDEEGYFWFNGRKDDVITSAGYRIGPSEIEDCLLKHPAVFMSAVIGSPDEIRGEIVKAFIMLKEGYTPGTELAKDIKNFVKNRLAAHEYPRVVEFTDSLPMTVTGKVMRKELRKLELQKKVPD